MPGKDLAPRTPYSSKRSPFKCSLQDDVQKIRLIEGKLKTCCSVWWVHLLSRIKITFSKKCLGRNSSWAATSLTPPAPSQIAQESDANTFMGKSLPCQSTGVDHALPQPSRRGKCPSPKLTPARSTTDDSGLQPYGGTDGSWGGPGSTLLACSWYRGDVGHENGPSEGRRWKSWQAPARRHSMQSVSGGSLQSEGLVPGVWNGGAKGAGQRAADGDHRHEPCKGSATQ